MPLKSITDTFIVEIGSGESLSAAIAMGDMAPMAFQALDGWTTANLTFQASLDGGSTWGELELDGSAVTVHFEDGSVSAVENPSVFAGAQLLKVRSGTSGAPVTQEAARRIALLARSF